MTDTEIISKLRQIGIKVARKTGNDLQCYCPLHEDKNPSLFVSLKEPHLWHCFSGCLHGAGIDNLIAQIAGQKPEIIKNPEIKIRKEENRKGVVPYIPILPLAIRNKGEDYLITRKITQNSIKKWNLMYWEDENAIVIPVEDKGFALRYISPKDKKYKYVNGTKVSETLFGLDKLMRDPQKHLSIILTEGIFDCIWCHQIGLENTLAVLGSNISAIQKRLLLGVTSKILILFDNDKGGVEAYGKATKILKDKFIVKRIVLPEGKDPNDCSEIEIKQAIQKEGGKDGR